VTVCAADIRLAAFKHVICAYTLHGLGAFAEASKHRVILKLCPHVAARRGTVRDRHGDERPSLDTFKSRSSTRRTSNRVTAGIDRHPERSAVIIPDSCRHQKASQASRGGRRLSSLDLAFKQNRKRGIQDSKCCGGRAARQQPKEMWFTSFSYMQ
jgi:hypothetical protein